MIRISAPSHCIDHRATRSPTLPRPGARFGVTRLGKGKGEAKHQGIRFLPQSTPGLNACGPRDRILARSVYAPLFFPGGVPWMRASRYGISSQ